MQGGGKRRNQRRVAIAASLALPALTLALAAGGGAGCVAIDGGAVEVAWAIFAPDGRAITDCACADPPIAYIRLNLVATGDATLKPCAGVASCRFACTRKIGATPFVIPPGQYLMSLVAVDADWQDIPETSARSPAAQSRSVVRGQPTELEAFMIETGCKAACNSSPTQPCAGG